MFDLLDLSGIKSYFITPYYRIRRPGTFPKLVHHLHVLSTTSAKLANLSCGPEFQMQDSRTQDTIRPHIPATPKYRRSGRTVTHLIRNQVPLIMRYHIIKTHRFGSAFGVACHDIPACSSVREVVECRELASEDVWVYVRCASCCSERDRFCAASHCGDNGDRVEMAYWVSQKRCLRSLVVQVCKGQSRRTNLVSSFKHGVQRVVIHVKPHVPVC